MARILSNIRLHRLAKRRDKALSDISFNKSYTVIAHTLLKENSEHAIKRKTLQMKRRLYPLEKKATSKKAKAQYKMEQELTLLANKQRLPRLAIDQTYIRKHIKRGKVVAEAYLEKALASLDKKEQKIRDKWSAISHKGNWDCRKEDVERYQKALHEETAKLDKYKNTSEQKMNQKLDKLQKKTNKITESNNKIIEMCSEKLLKLGDSTHKAMQMEDTVLEVNDLVMQFGGLRAVDNLSFKVREGEIFGLIGPNGAGKTTVFNCITQFNKSTSGSIYYRSGSGEVIDMTKRKVHSIIKTGIMRTFQNVELIWELSVLDNMLIGAHSLYHAHFFDHLFHTKKLRREEKVMKARALDVLERLNLLDYKDMIPFGLPYGILKKIELARTLMVHPRLIILDEPAAGLNETETEELSETILKIRDDYNCTIFLVEHDMGLVMDICDTVCAISFGKMLAIGTPHDIQTNAVVQEAYLGGTIGEDDNE